MDSLVAAGHALIDVSYKVDFSLLERLGIAHGSWGLVSHEEGVRLRERLGEPFLVSPGGSAANTLHAFARRGGSAAMLGMVGCDDDGRRYMRMLADGGVTPLFSRSESSTGCCVPLISPDGERSMRTYLGAAVEYRTEHLGPHLDRLRHADFLHLEGFLVADDEQYVMAQNALRAAYRAGTHISVDIGAASLVREHRDRLAVLVRHAEVVFANEEEARAYTGLPASESVRVLGESRVAAVKCGAAGSLVWDGELHAVDAVPCVLHNANGAGDVYDGAFLAALVRKVSPARAGVYASRAAAGACSRDGAW